MPKSKLPYLPFLPYIACNYCKQMERWNKDHESELKALARGLCRMPDQSKIFDFLASYLDRCDHSDLGPKRQLEIINAIHEETGCSCQQATIDLITSVIRYHPQSAPPSKLNSKSKIM